MAKARISREDIIKAAAEVVRKEGAEGLNARRIAAELGCSTQPVYSQFKNMSALSSALSVAARAEYRRRIDENLRACPPESRYEAYGLAYVRFAREEKGLFRYLNSSRAQSAPPLVEEPYLADIIAEIKNLYGMDEARAFDFHGDMAIYSYGLASQLANGRAALSDEEIIRRLRVEFYALYAYYFPERPPLPRKE